MAVETGLQWLVYVDTTGASNWVKLPQQTEGSVSFSTNDADATNKDNSGWADSVTISRSWSVSVSGMADPDDTAYLFLLDSVAFGTTTDHAINIKVENADGDTITGSVKVDSVDRSFGMGEIVNYSASFTGRGQPTVTRA